MKNMLRILGIVLTIAMLSGLLMAVVPVSTSAANLSWSNYTLPQVTVGTSANVFAFSGDGKTMYMFTSGTVNPTSTTTGKLYKSTDGGITWSNSSLDNTTPQVISLVNIKQIAINPANINDIIATDGAHVYRSINAGQTFYIFDPTTPPGTVVTSIDVANGSSGLVNVLVGYSGTPGGVALFDSSVGTYRTTNFSATASLTGALGASTTWGVANALAVAFSPNFTNDAAIITVSANATLAVRGMVVSSSSDWNQSGSMKDAILKQSNVPVTPTATQIATVAMPSDFVPTSTVQNRIFVGIGDTNLVNPNANNGNDVYRVNGGTSSSNAYALGSGINVSDVAFAGTATAGQLAAASYTGNTGFPTGVPILSTNMVTSNSPTWNQSNNSPSGVAVDAAPMIKFLPGSTATAYTLYAGTGGSTLPAGVVTTGGASKYSELATSTDLNSFWGIGLYEVSAYDNIVVGSSSGRGTPTVWTVLTDREGATASSAKTKDAMLFYSADSGTTYKKILDNGIASISINKSPAYATDKTMYLTQADNTTTASGSGIDESKQIVKTSDAGLTWNLLNTPGNVAQNWFTAIDANSYWVASVDKIQNSSSSTYATIGGNTPNQMFVYPGMFVVTTKNTGEVWLSTDSGVTFNRLGNASQFANNGGQTGPEGIPNPITFDVPNKTIYLVDLSTHNIMKWTVGTDSSWQIYLNATSLPLDLQSVSGTNSKAGHPISSLSLGSDGIWYITSNNNYTGSTPGPQIWYTSDLLNIPFSGLTQSDVVSVGGILPYPYGTGLTKDATGNSVFYTSVNKGSNINPTSGVWDGIFHPTTGTTTLSPNGYPYQVMTYTNTLLTGVKTTAPDGKAPAGTSISTSNGTFDQVDFSWAPVSYNNPKYHFQVAYDKAFNSMASTANNSVLNNYNSAGAANSTTVIDLNYLPSNSVSSVPLSPGKTYYWRVRVEYPVVSKWSDPIMFTTVVTSSTSSGLDEPGRISPLNGATGISITPAITWGSVAGVTGYDFKISTDPTFADATKQVDSFTNKATTVYAPSKPLNINTTYYWEVRALNGTAAGEWVISAFTTQATAQPTGTGTTSVQPTIIVTVPAQTQPTIVVTVPVNTQPAPAPATPAYIWVIIVIGAVLVIAVIVLIARTRRV
jgi:hypothetical protein